MVAIMLAGLLATLSETLAAFIAGVAVFTFGFFATHSLASGWVGRRAQERRALGAAVYLCSYYLGSSIIGTVAGLAWREGRWAEVVAILGLCTAATLLIALRLRRLSPIGETQRKRG
jgi:YNFM family putative membrane transporter